MVKFWHFLLTGYGLPLLNMVIWCTLRILKPGEDGEKGSDLGLFCPFLGAQSIDFFAYKIPIIFLLGVNSFFLVWIMVIVLSKLRSQIALDHDRRHLKAAKALTAIIPLFGFNYFLTLVGPDPEESEFWYMVFQIGRSVLISLQGAIITLPYCFLNSEVRGVLSLHWSRWLLVRSVGARAEFQTTVTGLGQSGADSVQTTGASKKRFLAITKMETTALLTPTSRLSQVSQMSQSRNGSGYSDDTV